jgi:molybdenum cofactor guanylyltransferase
MSENQDIDGWIIAGGSSTRMGVDKAALEIGGIHLIELAARAVSAVAGERISIAGATRDFAPRYPAFPDSDETGAGPMAGLASALVNGSSEWIAVIACDMPFITGEVFRKLADRRSPEVDAVVPIQPDDRPQPLCALYRRKPVLDAVPRLSAGEDRSLRAILREINTRYVDLAAFREIENTECLFLNVNSPGDYARAKDILDRKGEPSR